MSTCVAEIERSKKDTLKIICDGKSFFSASQNCSWQAYLVCHAEDMWAASGGKRSKTSETASFFSFWVNSRRSFTDGQSFQKDGKLYHVYYRWGCCESLLVLVIQNVHPKVQKLRCDLVLIEDTKYTSKGFLPRNKTALKFASLRNEDFCCNMISFEFLLVYFAASELQCMTINEFCIETFIFRRMKASQSTSPGS